MENYIIFSANYPPHVGGVDRYSQHIAHELAHRGNKVYVVTSSLKGQPDNEHVNENLEIIRLPSMWFLGDRMPVLRQTKMWRETRKRLSRIENPRVIIQTFLYPLSYAGARLARQMGWPFIVINHGCDYVCQGKGLVDKAEHVYEEILARLVAWRSNGCFAVSKAAGEWVEHFGITFAGTIYNGIEADQILDRLKALPYGVRKQYNIDSKTVLVAFVGRMIPEKGIVQLVSAVRKMIIEGKDVALIAAGDGEMLDKLKEEACDSIIFLGNTAHDDVLRLFRESDCCCLPSDVEGFGLVFLEAALCDTYLVGSPYGGIPEAIGEYGTLMPDNTQESIMKAIGEMMTMDNRQEILEKSKERAKGFSWEATCIRIESLPWIRNEYIKK